MARPRRRAPSNPCSNSASRSARRAAAAAKGCSIDRAELVVVWATLDRNAGRAAIKSFVVEKGTPGFKLVRLEHKLGIRASDTAQLALGADIRIARGDAQLSIMEAKWGLVPDMGGMLLRELVPIDVARELTYTARVFSGDDAHALGLVTHLADDPLASARALAAEIAVRSPDAVAASKVSIAARVAGGRARCARARTPLPAQGHRQDQPAHRGGAQHPGRRPALRAAPRRRLTTETFLSLSSGTAGR
ncbi:MAG: enoyl-CoA hydratase-related protein [Solimonas sp.]